MRFHAQNLLAQVRFEIVKGIEVRGFACDRTHLTGQVRPQLVLLHFQQAAIGVVDDDELLGIEQVVRNDQRPQRVIRGNPAGIADHMCISGLQSQAALKEDSGIHAGQHRHAAPRLNGKISQVEILYKFLIGFQQFVGD